MVSVIYCQCLSRLIPVILFLLPSSAMASLLYASGQRTDSAILQDSCDTHTVTGIPIVKYQEIADDVTFSEAGVAMEAEFVYSTWPAARRRIVAELNVYSGATPAMPGALLLTRHIEVVTQADDWATLAFSLALPVDAGDVRYFSVRLVSVDPMPSSIGPFLSPRPALGEWSETIWLLPVGAGRIWRAEHYGDLGTLAIRVYGVPEPAAAFLLAMALTLRRFHG